jgi:hypothetical protein
MKMSSTFGLSLGEADQTLSEIISNLLSSLTVSSNIQSKKGASDSWSLPLCI